MSDVRIRILTEDEATAKLAQIDSQLGKFSTKYNQDFARGLDKGTASTRDFGRALVDAADKAGLGTSQISRMASATGFFTKEQLAAGQASANVARKAEELAQAVQKGSMTTREAGAAFREYAKEQEVAGSKSANFAASLRTVMITLTAVTAGLAIAGALFKKALDFAAEGAQLERLQTAGQNLARGLGGDYDLIIAKIKEASRYTVSESDAMLAANRAMMLGLSANADQLGKLMEVAAFRGRAMGLSTTQAFSDIVTGIGRMSPLILDNLGIVIDAEKRYQEYAKAHGVAASAIDSTTKRQILLNAVLEDGNRQITAAGGLTTDAAAGFEKLAAAQKDWLDAQKQSVGGLGNLAGAIGDYISLLADGQKAVTEGKISQQEFREILQQVVFTELTAAEGHQKLAEAMSGAGRTTEELATKQAMLKLFMQETTGAAIDQADVLNQAMADLQTNIAGAVGKEIDSFNEKQASLREQAAELQAQIGQLEGLSYLTPEQQGELATARYELMLNGQAATELANAHDEATKRIIFDMAVQRASMDGLTQAEFAMLNDIALAWGLVDQSTWNAAQSIDRAMALVAQGNVQAAKQEILNLGQAAQSITGDYYMRFHVTTTYGPPAPGQSSMPSVISNEGAIPFTPAFPKNPASFSPSFSGGGGGGSAAIKTPKAPAMPKKSALEKIMDVAGGVSALGSAAVDIVKERTIDPLEKKLKAIQDLLKPGHVDLVGMERMAELEKERAEAAEKVAKAQEKILALEKAQQKLKFLEQQVQLLDLIKTNKLNAGNILKGLKFGVDANMEDVIVATTRALEELIVKAEAKLGIHSPSTVFAGIGKNITLGLAQGITANMGAANKAMNAMLAPPAVAASGHLSERPAGGAVIQKIEVNLPVQNVNSLIDWEAGARTVARVIREKVR
jgi:hypothetical protein